ncbi:sulfotransferase 1 family member D1-like isoform X1 [Maniola hyperantus]|uniref:sulfotransferase 1 family member D1-like isoform X1 n=1 Tax=Aphantopus hyperantus TaxID=2795564 RepID=UPI00156A410E|nr:sulfotransferase 1 family member D1-like isoform X1 [Maniola hyperantus]
MVKQRDPEEFPYEIQDVEPDLAAELMVPYTGELTGFVRVGPKGYFFPHKYKECAASFYNLPIRPGDVFVNTFPRSGTTWAQELIWLLKNNCDFEKASEIPLNIRFPFLDFSMLIHPELTRQMYEENKGDEEKMHYVKLSNMAGDEKVNNMPSPRFIKSHLPLSLLPPTLIDKAKVVYVARDPRDVVVSVYHLCKMHRIHGAPDSFKEFWNYFIKDQHYYCPLFEHVKEAWNLRNHPNMMFIFYEELYENLPFTIQRLNSFLGAAECTPQQVERLCDHLSFAKFKHNKAVNHSLLSKINFINGQYSFIRKGKMGGWRDYFDSEMIEQAKNWFTENLHDTDLAYPSMKTAAS